MLDIIHKFNMLPCFEQGSNNINDPMNNSGQYSIDSGVQAHDSGLQSHDSGVHPHDVTTHEAHDSDMVVY